MNHPYDVAVVGAGPAGSYLASLCAAAGCRVALLERGRTEDVAPRCTGVVGLPYVDLVGVGRDVVLAEARSVVFVSPAGVRMRVVAPEPQACVLDRALLERRLRARSVAAGVLLVEGVTVSHIAREADGIALSGLREDTRETYRSRAVVLAAGVFPGLSRQCGLSSPRRYLVGAHAELLMDGVPETEVHFLPDLAPGAFAWLVPVGGRRVRVGVLARRSAATLARRFLARPGLRERVVGSVDTVVQRPVPVSVAGRTYADGVLALGDAAGQVKPTTGGGLYFGAVAAGVAAEVLGRALDRGDLSAAALCEYERGWRSKLAAELRRGAFARRIYNALSPGQVDRVIGRAVRSGLADRLMASDSFSFDQHSRTLLLGLAGCLPGLIWASGTSSAEEAE